MSCPRAEAKHTLRGPKREKGGRGTRKEEREEGRHRKATTTTTPATTTREGATTNPHNHTISLELCTPKLTARPSEPSVDASGAGRSGRSMH